MERVAVNTNGNGTHNYDLGKYNYNYTRFCNGVNNGDDDDDRNRRKQKAIPTDEMTTTSSSSSPSTSAFMVPVPGDGGGVGFIEHKVSKLDTLAGVAIKYGVEVADIKKMNGLVTDLQMFALKSLQIPLPGRHPPSPCLSDGSHTQGQDFSERTPARRMHLDFLDSFQSLKLTSSQRKVTPAMSSLQGYYGLKPMNSKTPPVDCEMAVYSRGVSGYRENEQYLTPLPASNRPLSQHRKSRSLANDISDEINGGFPGQLMAESSEIDSERGSEQLVRRRQKSETDFNSHRELLAREDNSAGSYSAAKVKGLAQRSNATNRNASSPLDAEVGGLMPVPMVLCDSPAFDGFSMVRKSSSASNLQEHEGSASLWPAILKPDLQAFTAVSIAKPIFDGLPKPVTGRRNKAALD